jgi:hypothetical protein
MWYFAIRFLFIQNQFQLKEKQMIVKTIPSDSHILI